MLGMTLHDFARVLWEHLGDANDGWMEFCGLAASNYEQLMVFRYHPTLNLAVLAGHHNRKGLGCFRHGLIGDPVRLFEISDREHAILWDDQRKPFDTACGWLNRLIPKADDTYHCLVWRSAEASRKDLMDYATEHQKLTIHSISSRRTWARLTNPIFLYERRGSDRIHNAYRCWWRLTTAALQSLETIQWTPNTPRHSRYFSHYSGDYFSPVAPPDTDVNDLFESLLVTQIKRQRPRKIDSTDDDWTSPMLQSMA